MKTGGGTKKKIRGIGGKKGRRREGRREGRKERKTDGRKERRGKGGKEGKRERRGRKERSLVKRVFRKKSIELIFAELEKIKIEPEEGPNVRGKTGTIQRPVG